MQKQLRKWFKSHDVTWIEQETNSKRKISPETKARLLKKLEDCNVHVFSDHDVIKITTDSVTVQEKQSKIQTYIETDQVVFAMGVQPFNPLESKLLNHVQNVHVIGDAAGFSSLAEATHQGFKTAYSL